MNLFLDMDGVLADFDKRATQVLNMTMELFEKKHGTPLAWAELQATPEFFNSFDLMPDALDLWNATKHLDPIILTGVPRGLWAEQQKRHWIHRHFGKDIPFIGCKSRQKPRFCNPGDVIVDDKEQYKPMWEKKGGIWIVHKSAKQSIHELKRMGVI